MFALAASLTAQATTYYMRGQDGGGKSSFTGARSANTIGWATTRDGSVVANATMSGNDFIVQDGTRLRTGTAASQSFGGASLTLEAGGEMYLKAGDLTTKVLGTISIPQLIGAGGAIVHSVANTQTINGGTVSINAGKSLNVKLSPSNRTLIIASEFVGDNTAELAITSSFESGANGQVLELQDGAGFFGTITGSKYNADASGTFALKVTGGFSGTITSLPSDTTQILVNYDGLLSGKGLCVATTTIPEPLKNTVVLYSNKKSALSAGDVVMTFPAGTEVVPAEFAVAFAHGVSGAVGTALPLENVVNDDGTISLVVKNGGGSTYVWTGEADDGKMSTGGNWEGESAPGAGAALDFSKVTAATSIAANGLTYGAVTMGTGVITFSGSLTATSFSDTVNISVAANSIVTLDGDLKFSNTIGRYILNTINDGGRFVVRGNIEHSNTAELKPFSGGGVLVAKGLVSNAKKGTGTGWDNIYLFRLTRPSSSTLNWIVGENGISGQRRFWCFSDNYSTVANIQPNDSDFSVTTTIGVDAKATLNLNTTGYDGKTHKITFNGNGSINQEGTVNIKGNGIVELVNSFNGGLTVNVMETATLSVKRGKSPGNANSSTTVKGGATLEIAESAAALGEASVTPLGNLTLEKGATLKFNFTNRRIAPVLARSNNKTATVESTVYVKVSADASIERPCSGEHILTSGIDFTGKTVDLADGNPDWVTGVSVDDSGNIVLNVESNGTLIIIR